MPRQSTRCQVRKLSCALLLLASTAVYAEKVLNYTIEAAETGFDPAATSDTYSALVISNILEPLLSYDPLVKPATLVPNTSAAMPEVSADGRVYTVRVRPGIYFADDAAFAGKKRELTAQDYVYSLQRIVDPNGNAPWSFLLAGKVIGLDEKIERAKKNRRYDYDAPLAGLQAVDRYTLQIRLTRPDFNLSYILAQPACSALAREVVEKYGRDIDAHPVGTGPYRLKSWQRANRMVLVRNPAYRTYRYTPPPGKVVDPVLRQALQSHPIPSIDRVEIRLIESGQSAWLSFLKGQLDILPNLSSEYSKIAAPAGKLMPALAARSTHLFLEAEPDLVYTMFNMEDPVVGGYGADKVALRRAVAMSYNNAKEAGLIRNGQALGAQGPWAPGITGYDARYRNTLQRFDLPRANAILDAYGYRDRNGDGWRERPDGKPLQVSYLGSGGGNRDLENLLKNGMDKIGVRLVLESTTFPDLLKRQHSGKFQLAGSAWGADYPDVENFLQLLYGPNKGQGNDARFDLPAFNALYRDITHMPDSPARNAKVLQMMSLAAAYSPWMANVHRVRTHLSQGWVKGFAPHPIEKPRFMFMDIDEAKRHAFLQGK